MNGLDLFSGIGGITLALSEWVRPIAYCEIDRYCQGVLLSRMRSGDIGTAPIWDNVRTLKGEMLPKVDIIYGGFPCQDISIAGNGKGLEGQRSGLFFEILRLVKELNPTLTFLENVPAIRSRGLGTIVTALAAEGYDCRWTMLSAEEVGAPHKRQRWFLLAADTKRLQLWEQSGRSCGTNWEDSPLFRNNGSQESLANSNDKGSHSIGEIPKGTKSITEGANWWSIEPSVGRVVNGLPNRVDRIKGLGNAVVPFQAREAFKELIGIT